MSAFVVSHDHIDALLTFASDKRMLDRLGYYINQGRDKLTATDIGRVLLAENERSVCHLYPDCTPGDAPGKIGEEAIGYRFQRFEPFATMLFAKKLAWVLKGCRCFAYQACETPDWEQPIAHRIICAIEAEAIRCLPYFEEAPWGIDRARAVA